MSTTLTLDALSAVKEKQQATWASGNYATIGTTLQIMGENLCEAVDVSAGSTVLDVAAGKCHSCSASVRRDTHRTSPTACTPPWRNGRLSSSVQATASSSMRYTRVRLTGE
jgi:hypothetical protein